MTPLLLWQLGLSVIPVPRPGGAYDGKHPARGFSWKRYQTERPTVDDIYRWFGLGPLKSNLAIITGAVSGVVVVDVDSPEAQPWVKQHLVRTPWIVKTARGWHLYYRHPGVPIGNRAHLEGMKLDVRGDGGYVIGPGSVHQSGHVYRRVGDWSQPLTRLPVLDVNLLVKPAVRQGARPPERPVGDVAERGRRYLAKLPRPIEGQGSDAATFDAACKLVRGLEVSPGAAVELLREWAPGFDPWWLRQKVDCALAFGKEPMGGRLRRAG